MAAFGLGKLPFFSPRTRENDDDAKFEDSAPVTAKRLGSKDLGAKDQKIRDASGAASEPKAATAPKIGSRDKQIDGQAMRRPVPNAAALEGGFLSLAGIRDNYMAEEAAKGQFVIRHIDSGKEISIAGVDYIQFADLTVSCAFLTRSNPHGLTLPTPKKATASQGNIHELTKGVAAAIDEGLLAEPESAEDPQDAASLAETIELGAAIEEALAEESREGGPGKAALGNERLRASDLEGGRSEGITITEAELLAGAGDDAETLRITGISCKQDGRLENNGDGSWIFHPEESFDGEIALELNIVDETGEEASVEAIITIEGDEAENSEESRIDSPGSGVADTGEAASPEAQPEIEVSAEQEAPKVQELTAQEVEAPPADVVQAAEEPAAVAERETESLSVKVSDLIGDEFEGENLRLHGFSQPSNGRLADNGDGTLSFTPDPGWDGSTLFEYSVIDDSGHIAVGRLMVELDPEDMPAPEIDSETAPETAPETASEAAGSAEDDLYAGARYEDVEVDEEDRLVGDSAEEMPYLGGGAPTYADAWAGSLGDGNQPEQPLDSAAETPTKKPKTRSSNAAAAEELFKKLDW